MDYFILTNNLKSSKTIALLAIILNMFYIFTIYCFIVF